MKNAKLAALAALIPALGLVAYFGAVVLDGDSARGGAALDDEASARRIALSSAAGTGQLGAASSPRAGATTGEDAKARVKAKGTNATGADGSESDSGKDGQASGESARRGARSGGQGGSSRHARSGRGGAKGKDPGRRAPGRGYAGSAGQIFAGADGAGEVSELTSDPTIDEAGADDVDDAGEEEDRPELGETVTTRVAGKIMTETRREGLPGATVHILVFHPLTTAQNGPTWTVVTSTQTDGQGLFTAALELPAIAPSGAPLAVLANQSDHVPAGAVPVSGVVAGHDTSLGVFWLGTRSQRLEGRVTPSDLALGSGLVDTGGLNPLAWDARQRDALLALFPARPLSGGTFQLDIAPRGPGQRSVSLVREGRWLGSTTVEWGPSEPSGPATGSGIQETSGPVVEIGRCAFTLGPETGLGGRVTRQGGGALGGATVTALGAGDAAIGIAATDPSGAFRFPRAPAGLQRFRVEHPEFLTREFAHDPLAGDPTFVLTDPRPDIPLMVLDPSGRPVTAARLTARGAPMTTPEGGTISHAILTQTEDRTSPTGEYRVTAPFAIQGLTIAAEGWFPKTLDGVENRPSAALVVRLEAARVVHQTARQAVDRSGVGNAPSHGIYWWEHEDSSLLAWSQENWLEFECDFGAEATPYDFELGVRNHRIVDNLYRFAVRVELLGTDPGMDPQTLSIPASETETRTGRLSLPARSGLQRVRITWLNDRWIPGQLDANIIVDWVKFHQRPPDAAGATNGG